MVEKAVNVEAKASLQPPFWIKEIDSRWPKGYRSSVKKDKDNNNWEHRNEDKNKDKTTSQNHSTNNQAQIQAFKKDKCHWNRQSHPPTEVNTTEMTKKDKDKAKNLSHIKCYTCKQKGHYANKCLKKSKNQ